ncbi:alanine--tRNA ligase [Tichowtungia aerotolerans]|uniref:Alanine--tRNA ligase n=1 Tax=Tichowtungia aerotolerans TaxID=2697043 RepID=A0A6P1M7L0_9BACT|nr:alanine--tRNA ligase [Tichowtungia aerotolerans]QHI70709.1 alanine--tRNA ligase [Tichowtungia aerotolerans]
MTSNEIRQSFLDFLESKQHTIVKSASLLPDAPNLLFTNAGMNQFVPIFLGQSNCPYQPGRAADTQKCIRAGGKHNDLEDVGADTYHHTFFEMLGNWSFGDYFKQEAIDWAWELLTGVWGFPKERLYATYFGGDDKGEADLEAKEMWLKYLPEERVVPGNRKDNFWMMGDTGPCGPCSELHVDLTPEGNCGAKMVNADSPQCIEIWNLVFIQFNADEQGNFNPLPACHVDTGMGFERACSIIQCTKGFTDFSGVISNYETDVFTPIFQTLEEMSGKKYGSSMTDPADIAFRVIADHIRCLGFSIADGILPSNEGRGYVLRRILRRAVRVGRALGFKDAFFYKLTDTLADTYGDAFPELRTNRDRVEKTLKAEEESFNRTLDRGIELFEQVVDGLEGKTFPADEAFKLYDTYGFPLDLTEVMARERGLAVDAEGFEKLMNEQRERARADYAAKKSVIMAETAGLDVKPTEFVGFQTLESEALVEAVTPGEDGTYNIILDKTPCYAEMGGQLGDKGTISVPGHDDNDVGTLEITDTQKQGELVVHVAKLVSGRAPEPGEGVLVDVDAERRADIQRHHTATHLFHWALHKVVSEDSRQRGSLVAPDRMRFDFNNPEKLSDEQIAEIEKLVNEKIEAALPVYAQEVPFTEVQKHPEIQQFFGEKYGDTVRVLQMGGTSGSFDGFSMELCGGCHVSNTGDIGKFKLMSESSIAAGIRRIEAACGKYADAFIEEQKTAAAEAEAKAKELEEKKAAAKARQAEMQSQAPAIAEELLTKVKDGLLIENLGDTDAQLLSVIMDALQPKLESTVAILGGVSDGKVALVCAVTPDLVKEGKNAGKIVGAIAKQCGGGGGGKPDRAQAGGRNPDALEAALAGASELI